jgi:hypothetical protein
MRPYGAKAKWVSAKDKENNPHSGINNSRMLVQGCHLAGPGLVKDFRNPRIPLPGWYSNVL